MGLCSDVSHDLASLGGFCITEDMVKVVFAAVCFMCAGVGSVLSWLAGDFLAASFSPDFPTWDRDPLNWTHDDTIARGHRVRARRISSIVARVGLIVLYLSVATGLVINFPNLLLALFGVVATVSVTIYGVVYLLQIRNLRWRIHVWERAQHLANITHGNVLAQNAVVQLNAVLDGTAAEVKRAEADLEQRIREEEARIDERDRQRHEEQAAREAANTSTSIGPQADAAAGAEPTA